MLSLFAIRQQEPVMRTPAAPPAPDPVRTANAQADMNRESATTQYGLAATNQVTPFGTLNYRQIGTWDDGTPRFEATTALSREAQDTADKQLAIENRYADIAGQQLGRAQGLLSAPFNISRQNLPAPDPTPDLGPMPAAYDPANLGAMPRGTDFGRLPAMPAVTAPDPASILPERRRIEDSLFARLNPQLDRSRAALETQLRNQGIAYGSEAWKAAIDDATREANDMRLAVAGQGGNEQSRFFDMMSRASGQGFQQGMDVRNLAAAEDATRLAQDLGLRDRELQEQTDVVDRQLAMRGMRGEEAQRAFANTTALRQQLINELLAERNQPLQELSTLMTGASPQMPAFQATPTPNVGGVDLAGLTMDAHRLGPFAQFQAEQQNRQAVTNGLFGLGNTAIGGWMRRR
jgi:hypothetical protein